VWVLLAAGAAGFLVVPRRARAAIPKKPSVRNVAIAAIPVALGPLPALGSLAFTFLKIGFVFFGGGFALIPVLHDRLVGGLGWLNAREFVDGVAISNLTPGPIAVLATFAGYRLAGIAGALVATASLFAPALFLMLFLSRQYERYRDDDRARRFLGGVNPAVTGLVFSAALLLGRSAMNSWRGFLFGAVSLLLLGRLRWPPAVVLALGAAAGFAGLLP
jgi:chromate transporter